MQEALNRDLRKPSVDCRVTKPARWQGRPPPFEYRSIWAASSEGTAELHVALATPTPRPPLCCRAHQVADLGAGLLSASRSPDRGVRHRRPGRSPGGRTLDGDAAALRKARRHSGTLPRRNRADRDRAEDSYPRRHQLVQIWS